MYEASQFYLISCNSFFKERRTLIARNRLSIQCAYTVLCTLRYIRPIRVWFLKLRNLLLLSANYCQDATNTGIVYLLQFIYQFIERSDCNMSSKILSIDNHPHKAMLTHGQRFVKMTEEDRMSLPKVFTGHFKSGFFLLE